MKKKTIINDFAELSKVIRPKRPRVLRVTTRPNYNDERFIEIRKQISELERRALVPAVKFFGEYKRCDPKAAKEFNLDVQYVERQLCKGWINL
jgi:hypothetical protein